MSPPALTHWLDVVARATPDAIALVAGERTVTYGFLAQTARSISARLSLHASPLEPANVGVVAGRTLQSVANLWAVWESPHTAVLLDPASSLANDDAQLAGLGIRVVVDDDDMRPLDGDRRPADPGHHSWILTSGSTGGPRPVILTKRNVAAAVAASQRRLGNAAADTWQLALPPAHVGGASVLWRSAAAGGAVVLDGRFDANRTAQRLADGAITMSSLVPTMLHRLLTVVDGVSPDVRTVLVGGAGASDGLVRRALDTGLPVVTTYGLTEACSQVATVTPGQMEAAFGTVGTPLDGMEVTIVDPDEAGVGVISVDGPAVSPGYAGEPVRRGPHNTGDVGRLDERGRLVVLGRGDDMIVTGGENVAPAAVENALEALSEVRHAVVFGIPNEEWGQAVVACVVPAIAIDAAAMADRVRDVLRPAARPRQYRFFEAFPELPNGKVDREAVREAWER